MAAGQAVSAQLANDRTRDLKVPCISTTESNAARHWDEGCTTHTQIHVFVFAVFGVKLVAKGPCEWDNLWLLVLVCHGLIPLVTIPLTFFLIPNNRLTDEMSVAPDDQPAEVRGMLLQGQ